VDLASDARLFPTDQGPGFQILSAEELAADKLLAVFGRAEARDFLDLEALEDRFGLGRLFELAAEKDRGFEPTVFAEMMDRFGRLGRAEFQLDDVQYEKLSRLVEAWRERALQLAQQHQRSRGLRNDRGPDTGHGHRYLTRHEPCQFLAGSRARTTTSQIQIPGGSHDWQQGRSYATGKPAAGSSRCQTTASTINPVPTNVGTTVGLIERYSPRLQHVYQDFILSPRWDSNP
jgi:hypothetical protein